MANGHKRTYFEHQEVEVYQRVLLAQISFNGFSLLIVQSVQEAVHCHLKKGLVLELLPAVMNLPLFSAFLAETLDILSAVVVVKLFVGIERIGKDGSKFILLQSNKRTIFVS